MKKNGILILDGGLASELERKGANLNDPLWSAKILLENPHLLKEVNYEYLRAGADIISTATYQASFEGFAQKGLSKKEATSLFKKSVEIAKEVRSDFWNQKENRKDRIYPLISASIGPYGAYLADGSEYTGNYQRTYEQIFDFHYPRMKLLAENGADIFAFETFPNLKEVEGVLKILEEFPKMTAWLSFTCKDAEHISDGTPIAEAVSLTNHSNQIIAIGFNCVPPQLAEPLLKKAALVTKKPLLIYPNNGDDWDANNKCWIPQSKPFDFEMAAKKWFELGARLIGGCCQTTPIDIQKIRKAKDGLESP